MLPAEADTDFAIARVVAVLDAVCQATDAMTAAIDIAARCNVELAGLFIEDDSLFRMASMPGARHLTLTPTARASFGIDTLETEMRSRANLAVAALGAAAATKGVHWSFRSIRGMPGALLRQAARSGDLLVFPGAAPIGGWPLRLHSPLLRAAGVTASSALIVRRPASFSRPLVVASADPDRVRRALAAARRLRAGDHDAIDVAVPGLARDVAARTLAGLKDFIRVRELRDATSRSVIDLAKSLGSDLIVLTSESLLGEEGDLSDELLSKADHQVLLVRQPGR